MNPSEEASSTAEGAVKSAADVALQNVPAGRSTSYQVLVGPGDGAPNFVLRRFVMGAGGGIPKHTNRVEHEQYVLRGRARVGIGEEVHEVARDSVLYIPAGVPHYYEVVEAPFEFLCVVPNSPDELSVLKDEGC